MKTTTINVTKGELSFLSKVRKFASKKNSDPLATTVDNGKVVNGRTDIGYLCSCVKKHLISSNPSEHKLLLTSEALDALNNVVKNSVGRPKGSTNKNKKIMPIKRSYVKKAIRANETQVKEPIIQHKGMVSAEVKTSEIKPKHRHPRKFAGMFNKTSHLLKNMATTEKLFIAEYEKLGKVLGQLHKEREMVETLLDNMNHISL